MLPGLKNKAGKRNLNLDEARTNIQGGYTRNEVARITAVGKNYILTTLKDFSSPLAPIFKI